MRGLSRECEPKLPRTKEVLEKLRIDVVEAYFVAAPFIFLIYKAWTLYNFWGALALTIILIVGYLVALEYLLWFKEWRVARKIKKEIEKKYHPVKGVKCLIRDPIFRDLLYRIKEAEELGWPYIPSVDRVPVPQRRVEIAIETVEEEFTEEEGETGGEEELLGALDEYAMEETQEPQEPSEEPMEAPQTHEEHTEIPETPTSEPQENIGTSMSEGIDLEARDREILNMLENLVRSLREEELHELFMILMRNLGYGKYSISRLARASGISRTTLRRYLVEGRLPGGPRIGELEEKIMIAFSRCLEANIDALVKTLEELAEKNNRHRDIIAEILSAIESEE